MEKRHIRTDAVDVDVDPGAQDLVPAVDAPDEPAGAVEGAGAAEGVREGGGGGEVFFYGGALDRRRGLHEGADYVRDFGGWRGGLAGGGEGGGGGVDGRVGIGGWGMGGGD